MRISALSRRSIENCGIITILSSIFLLSACNKNPPPTLRPAPPAAPAPTAFDRGESFFEDRNYSETARYYEEFLREAPSHPNADRAMFRAGLSRAFPGHALHDLDMATGHFERLVTTYPDSDVRAQSELILGLIARVRSLQTIVGKQDSQLKGKGETNAQLNDLVARHKREVEKQKDQLTAKEAQLRERDVKIREAEKQIQSLEWLLDKYKKIDMESRPSRPPD